jgi:hypothetical protein
MKIEKIRVYLDDVRTPLQDDWVVVRNYEDFVSKIRFHGLENIEVISLDHDLGDSAMFEYYNNVKDNYQIDYSNITEKTGYDSSGEYEGEFVKSSKFFILKDESVADIINNSVSKEEAQSKIKTFLSK